jgi:hypothetical protein
VRPKSPITKAIKYSLRQWEALTRFLGNGSIPIDNKIASYYASFGG